MSVVIRLAAPRSLLARILWLIVAGCIIVLAFFFLLAAVIAGALLAAALLARVWWIRRRINKTADAQFVTTEYRVVERERLPEPRLPESREDARH